MQFSILLRCDLIINQSFFLSFLTPNLVPFPEPLLPDSAGKRGRYFRVAIAFGWWKNVCKSQSFQTRNVKLKGHSVYACYTLPCLLTYPLAQSRVYKKGPMQFLPNVCEWTNRNILKSSGTVFYRDLSAWSVNNNKLYLIKVSCNFSMVLLIGDTVT